VLVQNQITINDSPAENDQSAIRNPKSEIEGFVTAVEKFYNSLRPHFFLSVAVG
jgi:hypothetical protein